MALARLRAPPVLDHAELAEREGHEDVDGVHHHQRVDGSAGVQQHQERGAAHQEHAVLHGEAVAEGAEAMRKEGILGQVGHHARAGDESRLRGDEQQQGLRRNGNDHVPVADGERTQVEVAGQHLRQHVVHRLAGHRVDAHQQVSEDDPARGDRQAGGHVDHGPLGGQDPRLPHDVEPVGDRLDAGVGARAQRVGAEEEQCETDESHGAQVVRKTVGHAARDLVGPAEVEEDAARDQDGVRRQEGEEDGHQDADRFPDAPEVQHGEDGHRHQLDRQLPDMPVLREVAEDGLAAGRHRRRAGEDVIDQQRRPAHHACARTDQARGDDVPPTAEGKMLDDLGVGRRDDQDGQPGREREEDGEVLVVAEVLERLLGAVGAGRQPVRAESYPGEECRQRKGVEEVRVLEVLGPAQQDPLESLPPADGPRDRRFGWGGRNGARRRGGRGLLHGRPFPSTSPTEGGLSERPADLKVTWFRVLA